jgi:hypothetical protein
MFDWSQLDKTTIVQGLSVLAPKLCDQDISFTEFHSILSRYLKKHYPVTITIGYDEKVKNHKLFVGGAYYSDKDEDGRKCIEINLHYNPTVFEFNMSKRRFKGICITIADTLLHEVIHMRQYRRRNFKALPNYASSALSSKLREEQEYLGCTDEIDAYGFNIACELLEKYKGDEKRVIKHLDLNLKTCKKSGGSWKMYLKAFEHNHKHEIIKRVKQKVIRYLPRAVEGKPFKSRDWICH